MKDLLEGDHGPSVPFKEIIKLLCQHTSEERVAICAGNTMEGKLYREIIQGYIEKHMGNSTFKQSSKVLLCEPKENWDAYWLNWALKEGNLHFIIGILVTRTYHQLRAIVTTFENKYCGYFIFLIFFFFIFFFSFFFFFKFFFFFFFVWFFFYFFFFFN